MAAAIAIHLLRRSLTKTVILLFVACLYLLHLRDDFPSLLPFHRPLPVLLRADAPLQRSLGREGKNLLAINEGVSRGPWIMDPPLPSVLDTTKNYTLTFACLWNPADMCPKRYIVILRGPTVYTPPLSAITAHDNNTVSVRLQVPEPGEYELFAWPDFEECPKYWQEHMKYPVNRGQVVGTPTNITVAGVPARTDSFGMCTSPPIGKPTALIPEGRWIAKAQMDPVHAQSGWARSYQTARGPEWMGKSDWIYQPYGCKRPRYDLLGSIVEKPDVKHILFMGDSVLRGSFCSQVWPAFSASEKADGACTFINDRDKYHIAPKHMRWTNGTRNIDLSFRFMDDKPGQRLMEVPSTLPSPPTHVIMNLGLWMAIYTADQYREVVQSYLAKARELFPDAVLIWRTTTDVAPQITCFSDKGMTRGMIAAQRAKSLEVVNQLRAERTADVHVIDGYEMSMARPDAANDGRHWVIESPEENGWMRPQRPVVGDAERAILDAVWEVIVHSGSRFQEASVESIHRHDATPEHPQQPNQPEHAEQPENPEQPKQPEKPEQPKQPEQPEPAKEDSSSPEPSHA